MRFYLSIILLGLNLVLLCYSARSQALTKHLLVQITIQDPENVYNSSYHRANMKFAKIEQIKASCFIEAENAFVLTVDESLSPSMIQSELGEKYAVTSIKVDKYQALIRMQAAKRLSTKSGTYSKDPTFPVASSYGNDKQGRTKYRQAIEEWLKNNPQKFQMIVQTRN